MTGIAEALRAAMRVAPDRRGTFRAAPTLQSWPGIVHGGGLLALFDEAAAQLGGPAGPRLIEGRLTSSIPIDTALAVEARESPGALSVTVLDDGQTLSSGAISALGPEAVAGAPAAPSPDDARAAMGGAPLPLSEQCLACGTDNPLGLQARLRVDDEGVWTRLAPRPPWVVDGCWHLAVVPVLLDEVAWWLGATVMGEGGLTNRLAVTLLAPDAPPATEALLASGRFADVSPIDRKRLFWRTATTLRSASGDLLARASIVFRGGPEYSERQVPYFRARTTPELFHRLFPRHGD
jgi:hypothetical protein